MGCGEIERSRFTWPDVGGRTAGSTKGRLGFGRMGARRLLACYKRLARPIILINGPPADGFASGTEMLQTSRETHSFDQRTFIELKDGSQNGPHKWVLEMGLARWP